MYYIDLSIFFLFDRGMKLVVTLTPEALGVWKEALDDRLEVAAIKAWETINTINLFKFYDSISKPIKAVSVVFIYFFTRKKVFS
ncbi:MAG: hypothetical protein BWX72_00472 [Firmicutes bacterium ADurb.Bin080]|nr:MAG: hypothetical protein BWX72_00472 [Firmicutes bacterium ADurb.Bin080]